MDTNDNEFKQDVHKEFLQALHTEKISTQSERADYTKSKLAFVIGLFGLGSLKVGTIEFHLLLYFIPLVAIGYDLYIQSSDISIKKMGAFLRSNPKSGSGDSEKAWEIFSAKYRDTIAPIANTLFTFVVTVAAAFYIYAFEQIKDEFFLIGFILWLFLFLLIIYLMWSSHRKLVDRIDKYETKTNNS